MARVTADELLHDLAGVLERVTAGEKVLLVEDGVALAVISPPDLTEAMTAGMVKAGFLDAGWRERQERTIERLRGTRRPSAPKGTLGSDTIAEMRNEERF